MIIPALSFLLQVISLTKVCENASPQPTIMCLVLFLAIFDTWTDGVVVSLCLSIVHLGILRLGKDTCCVHQV